MATVYNPKAVIDGLVLALDAGNRKSYPGSGTTWTDLSGRGNTGTLVNGVGYLGNNLGSLVFDGTNDVVNSTTSIIDRADGQEITVSCWIKPSRTSGQYSVFCTNRSNDNSIYNWIFYQHITDGAIAFHGDAQNKSSYVPTTNVWINVTNTVTASGVSTLYVNGVSTYTVTGYTYGNGTPSRLGIGADPGGQEPFQGNISQVSIYNRALTASEVQRNFNALKSRFAPDYGSISNPFSSPVEAQNIGYPAGTYYFKSGAMSSPLLLEYQPNYYENRPFCCVFRSPYRSTATTNRIDLNIPMGGLLVQRDALDFRAALYWSTPITYNTVGGSGNNTADSGYSPRRVILGGSGGHGIFATNQSQCNWGSATGAIGAGWDGSTCGSFPNDLVWGTGRSDTATYDNRSGTWSHWITWN
jgi:hypothetical protein